MEGENKGRMDFDFSKGFEEPEIKIPAKKLKKKQPATQPKEEPLEFPVAGKPARKKRKDAKAGPTTTLQVNKNLLKALGVCIDLENEGEGEKVTKNSLTDQLFIKEINKRVRKNPNLISILQTFGVDISPFEY